MIHRNILKDTGSIRNGLKCHGRVGVLYGIYNGIKIKHYVGHTSKRQNDRHAFRPV